MAREAASTMIRSDRWSYLWLVIGAVLSLLSNGRWTIPLATWLMAIFLLRFVRTQKVWVGFILVWLVSFATSAIAWVGLTPMELSMHLVMMGVAALVSSLPYLADRLLVPHLKGFVATLVFPLASTAIEFLSVATNPNGSWGALAYTQYPNLALIQLVSITGLWGFPFLMGWFASIINWAWERSFSWREVRRGLALFVGVMLLVMLYGSVRLAFLPPQAGTVRVASMTATETVGGMSWVLESDREAFRRGTRRLHDYYFEATAREARAGAKIVLWPEGVGLSLAEDEAALIERAQEVAAEEGIYLAMPMVTIYQDFDRPFENKLLIVDPDGDVVLEHYKYGGAYLEGSLPGDGVLRTVETPYGTLSGIICWDADFPSVVSQAGRNGTDILLVPSNDWRAVDPLHTQMAVFRAVENGVSLVRHVSNGLSIATDPYGRVLASMDHFTASERVMVAQVPTEGVFTVYSIIGDTFAWLSIVGFVVIVVWTIVRWRRG
jgi:apolipoprotein N-acyltransferase